jgi:hypothetical protein
MYVYLLTQGLYFASGILAFTPLTAGLISLINEVLIALGKKLLNWSNQWLYS